MGLMEKLLFGGDRAWACSRASGDVLEVAVGTGRNFTFYPDGIRLIGIELSAEMLAIARRRAQEVGLQAELLQGDHVPSTTRLWRDIQWLLEQVTVRLEGEHMLRRPHGSLSTSYLSNAGTVRSYVPGL
jgi:hypothetical protein